MSSALATTSETRLVKRAVIYLRVSTLKQAQTDDADGYSLPAQREACERKAEQLGAEVVDIYMDRGESAKTAERPHFQRMLARIRDQRDIDYVILDKVDRFARNRRDDANILFELRMAGAQLISVKENIDETPSGQLLHAIMAGIAEFYSKNLATETMKGMTQKAVQGGTPGRAPLGYLNTRRRGEDGREIRTVVVEPDRASLVQWAFEAYASGDWTIRSLTDALGEKGLRALPHGRKMPGPVQPSHVYDMLKNRYYIGMVSFNGVEYPGKHQPLVADSLFDRVQELLASHGRAGEKQRIYRHYLKGSVYCAECGYRLCITNAKGSYLYFFCLGRHQRRSNCRQPYMPVEAVEKAVERHYVTIRMPETQAEIIRKGLRVELDHQHRRSQPEISWAKQRLTELEQERRRLARGVISGAIPEDIGREEQDRIATELKQATAVLNTAETVYARIEQTLNDALAHVDRVHDVYRKGGPQVRRYANQSFFDKLLIGRRDDRVEVISSTLREPWSTLLAEDFQRLMADSAENPDPDSSGRGSKKTDLVPKGQQHTNRVSSKMAYLVHLSESLSNFPKRIEQLITVPLPDHGAKPLRLVRRALQRPNRKLSPAEIEQLVADYQAGQCLTELGKRYGLHRQTAKAHLERRGVTIRSELPALDAGQIAQAVAWYAEGFGLNPIATQLSVAPNTVKRALLARGVRLRPRGFAQPRPA